MQQEKLRPYYGCWPATDPASLWGKRASRASFSFDTRPFALCRLPRRVLRPVSYFSPFAGFLRVLSRSPFFNFRKKSCVSVLNFPPFFWGSVPRFWASVELTSLFLECVLELCVCRYLIFYISFCLGCRCSDFRSFGDIC